MKCDQASGKLPKRWLWGYPFRGQNLELSILFYWLPHNQKARTMALSVHWECRSIPRLLIAKRKKLTFCSFLIRVLDVSHRRRSPVTTSWYIGQLIFHFRSHAGLLQTAHSSTRWVMASRRLLTAYQNAKSPNRVGERTSEERQRGLDSAGRDRRYTESPKAFSFWTRILDTPSTAGHRMRPLVASCSERHSRNP